MQGCECTGHMYTQEVCICAPLSLQGAQMPCSHWPGRGLNLLPPTPQPRRSSPSPHPCLLPLPTVGLSLLFQLTLHWCGERAFDIHNLVQRRSRSPESRYGFHGNRLVHRGGGGGEGKHIVKIQAPQVWLELDQLPSWGTGSTGQGSGVLVGGAASPHPLGLPLPPWELLSSFCGSWQVLLLPRAF